MVLGLDLREGGAVLNPPPFFLPSRLGANAPRANSVEKSSVFCGSLKNALPVRQKGRGTRPLVLLSTGDTHLGLLSETARRGSAGPKAPR